MKPIEPPTVVRFHVQPWVTHTFLEILTDECNLEKVGVNEA